MTFKVFLSLALLTTVRAVPILQQYHVENEAPAHYEFSYAVNDEHTGDIKSQQETRNGDAVQGHYELIDSDGFKRIVDYTADDVHGFIAVVRREPTNIKIPVPSPVLYSHHTPTEHYASQGPLVARHFSTEKFQHASPVNNMKMTHEFKSTTSAPSAHYINTVQPSPVQHQHQSAHQLPQHRSDLVQKAPLLLLQHTPAPVQHSSHETVAPIVVKSHDFTHDPDHVTFQAPGINYNY